MGIYKAKIISTTDGVVMFAMFSKSKLIRDDDGTQVTVLTPVGTATENILLAEKEVFKGLVDDVNAKLNAITVALTK